MRYMFSWCKYLKKLNLSGFNTSKVTDMYNMFSECPSLEDLDISNFNNINVKNIDYIFSGCSSLKNREQLENKVRNPNDSNGSSVCLLF